MYKKIDKASIISPSLLVKYKELYYILLFVLIMLDNNDNNNNDNNNNNNNNNNNKNNNNNDIILYLHMAHAHAGPYIWDKEVLRQYSSTGATPTFLYVNRPLWGI